MLCSSDLQEHTAFTVKRRCVGGFRAQICTGWCCARRTPRQEACFKVRALGSGAAQGQGDSHPEVHAVETAIKMNALIFISKVVVWCITSSSSMLSEAIHSLVDIANQVLLRIGISSSQLAPSRKFPYGYSKDQFIWPLISAVGIFCCGAGVTFIHGVQGLFATREVMHFHWNYIVLAVSGVLEGYSLMVALKILQQRAKRAGLSLGQYIRTGADPAATAVVMEDGAAVAGLAVAAIANVLVQLTGCAVWDALGSMAVALLLGAVAIVLIHRNRQWLIGKSMPEQEQEKVVSFLMQDPVVKAVYETKSEELGVERYRFKAEIAFNGRAIAQRCLGRVGRTRLYEKLVHASQSGSRQEMDEVLSQYTELVVSSLGAEVDRLEREVTRISPGLAYVDLETDRGQPRLPPSLSEMDWQDWYADVPVAIESDCGGFSPLKDIQTDSTGMHAEGVNGTEAAGVQTEAVRHDELLHLK